MVLIIIYYIQINLAFIKSAKELKGLIKQHNKKFPENWMKTPNLKVEQQLTVLNIKQLLLVAELGEGFHKFLGNLREPP